MKCPFCSHLTPSFPVPHPFLGLPTHKPRLWFLYFTSVVFSFHVCGFFVSRLWFVNNKPCRSIYVPFCLEECATKWN